MKPDQEKAKYREVKAHVAQGVAKLFSDFQELLSETEARYNRADFSWVPTTVDHYDYFLNVLPPALQSGHVFAVGEPWKHDNRNRPIQLCFRCLRGHPPEARYATLLDLRTEMKL